MFSAFIAVFIAGGFIFSATILFITALAIFEWNNIVSRDRSAITWWNILGLALILPASLSVLYLRYEPGGTRPLLLLCLSVWSTDIAAYFVGRHVGGIKLAPKISPNKTVSGCFGGLVASAVLGGIFGWFSGGAISAMTCAVIISILGQIGDLLESALKRKFGVKDSGVIIPGHGGVLDRIDSFVLSAPFVMLYFL